MAVIQLRLDTAQLNRDIALVQRNLQSIGRVNIGLNLDQTFQRAQRAAAGLANTVRTIGTGQVAGGLNQAFVNANKSAQQLSATVAKIGTGSVGSGLDRTFQNANRSAQQLAATVNKIGTANVGKGLTSGLIDAEKRAVSLANILRDVGSIAILSGATGNVGTFALGLGNAATAARGLVGAIGPVGLTLGGIGVAAGLAAGAIVSLAAEFNSLSRAVLTVVPDISTASDVSAQLVDISNRTGLSIAETGEAFKQFSFATKSMNLTTQETIDLTELITRTLSVYAQSTGAAAAASIQLAQGFAKGRFDGDELKTVLETLPALTGEVAKIMGVTAGEVRQLGADGKITGEIVKQAFENLEPGLDAVEERVGRSLPKAFNALSNSVSEFFGRIDQSIGLTSSLVAAIDGIASGIGSLTNTLFPTLSSEIETNTTRIAELATELRNGAGTIEVMFGAMTVASGVQDEFNQLVADTAPLLEEQRKKAEGAAIAQSEFGRATGESLEEVIEAQEKVAALAAAEDELQQLLVNADPAAARHAERLNDIKNAADLAAIGAVNFANEILGDGGAIEKQIAGINDEFEQTAERAKAAAEAAKAFAADLGEFLLENSAAAAREAEAQDRLNEILEQQAKLREEIALQAEEVAGAIARAFDASEAEVRQFVENASGLARLFGFEFGETFDQIFESVSKNFGLSATELSRFFNIAGDGFRILGVEAEDVLGKRLTTTLRILGSLSKDTIDLIVESGRRLLDAFSAAIPVIGQVTQGLGGAGAAAKETGAATEGAAASFGSLAAAGSLSFAALAAGSQGFIRELGTVKGVIVSALQLPLTATVGIFELFGINAAGVVAKVVNAFGSLKDILLAIATGGLSVLLGAFVDLGDVVDVVLKPIEVVFRAIRDAVQFLIGLFTGGGGLSDAFKVVGVIASAALAPIILLFEAVRAVVEFLANLIRGNLGGAFQVLGGIASSVFNGILAVGQAVFGGLQAAGQALLSVFSGIFNTIGAVFSAVWNGMRALGQAVFSALQAAGQVLGSVLAGVWNVVGSVFGAVWNGMRALGQAVFSAIQAAGQALGGALSGVFNTISNIFSTVFNGIRSIAQSVFSAIIGAGQAMGSALGSIASSIGSIFSSAFNGIASAAKSAFNAVVSGAKSAVGAISDVAGAIAGIGGKKGAGGAVGGGILGGILGGGVGSVIGGVGGFIGGLFGKGGLIKGPITMAGPNLGGGKFARGTLLGGQTLLGGRGSVTATKNLGLAGEAGPEAIVPLARTSGGKLGINAAGLGGGVRVFIIQGVDRTATDRLERQFLSLDASVEFRAGLAAEQLLLGAV